MKFRALALGALLPIAVIGAIKLRGATEASGYPLVALTPGAGAGLWKVAPAELERATAEDSARLEAIATRMSAGIALAEKTAPLLDAARVDDLDADSRQRIRDVWLSVMDPLLELDAMKRRYEGWFGVDYVKHPALHARAFVLTQGALATQVAAGQRFIDLVGGRRLAQTLFDEAAVEQGIPKGSFSHLRRKLTGTRDQAFVPVGAEWYRLWLARHLTAAPHRRFDELLQKLQGPALAAFGAKSAVANVANHTELMRSLAYARWFPVQKEVAEWAGDTRFVPEHRRLIRDAQLEELRQKLQPGDVIVERRNWYLSNVGLPGFWPHAALFVGSAHEIAKTFDDDPEVVAAFGKFSEHLRDKRGAAFRALQKTDDAGHPHRVVEAVSEGVVAASLEHSCGADYVGALRTRLPRVEVARAIDRALSYFGRPYDFDFDFATDDAIVCSELVLKSYEPKLRVPFVVTAGRRTVPPTELVRLFASERTAPSPQLDFVGFLEGEESTHSAKWSDAIRFAASASRAKWDLVQP